MHDLGEACYEGLSVTQGRPVKDARLAIGEVIIKHKLNLADPGESVSAVLRGSAGFSDASAVRFVAIGRDPQAHGAVGI